MEHLDHPSPDFNDAKMARFELLRAFIIALGGGGMGITVPLYTVQDCRSCRAGNNETELMKIFIKCKTQRLSLLFLTYPSVDAVTIATFPSSLRLAAAVELILIALKVPKHNFALELRSVIFLAFFTCFRAGLELSSPYMVHLFQYSLNLIRCR